MYPDPQDGRAIINNMQVNVFCKFDTASICQEIGAEYRLSQEMIDEMTKLGVQKDRQGAPTHSKFMMLIGKQVYILNNYLHPFEYQLYSSSADDNAIIDYYLQEIKLFETLEEVLWYIAEKKHIGDKGLIAYLNNAGATTMAERIQKRND
jgi:N-acetylneuraminic acid mutarotase